ncbi:putative non-hem dioxygenase domain, isopenicillin N synthase [Helianthus debilis subsp. tardiflorus]
MWPCASHTRVVVSFNVPLNISPQFKEPQIKLPVIDLSSKSLDLNSSSWVTKCDEVRHALKEYECFITVYDGVSRELHDAIFLASQELFNIPTEVKL